MNEPHSMSSDPDNMFNLTQPSPKNSLTPSPIRSGRASNSESDSSDEIGEHKSDSDGIKVIDDVTPEEILVSSLSNSGELRSVLQSINFPSAEEDEEEDEDAAKSNNTRQNDSESVSSDAKSEPVSDGMDKFDVNEFLKSKGIHLESDDEDLISDNDDEPKSQPKETASHKTYSDSSDDDDVPKTTINAIPSDLQHNNISGMMAGEYEEEDVTDAEESYSSQSSDTDPYMAKINDVLDDEELGEDVLNMIENGELPAGKESSDAIEDVTNDVEEQTVEKDKSSEDDLSDEVAQKIDEDNVMDPSDDGDVKEDDEDAEDLP